MALDHKHRFVTFRPVGDDQPRIFLDVDQIERRGGLEPDVWEARVPYTELANIGLGEVSTEVPGYVELWYSNAPDSGEAADVTLGNVAIVNVRRAARGVVADEGDDPMTYEYSVTIADHRRAFIAPRGGLLLDGNVNPDPLPPDATLAVTSELMQKCADAMGVPVTISDDADDADPIRELDCSDHAPTILQALLEHSGLVYAPLISGHGQVVKPGTAIAPTPPAGRLVSDTTADSIDRRATRAIFTSMPAAEIHSYTHLADPAPSWKYVAQDPDDHDRWKRLANITALGGDPAAAWANQCRDVDETKRQRLYNQLYRCVQLDPAKYPPGKVQVLPHYLDVELRETEIRLRATGLLAPRADGSYVVLAADEWLVPKDVVPAANVLVFDQPLVKPSSGTARRQQLGPAEVAIAESAIKPWFSVEGWDAANDRRRFGVFGFTVSGFGLGTLSEATARDSLTGYRPDTCIYRDPSLQVVNVNGTSSSNRDDVEARCETYARNAVGVTTPALREQRVKGFWAVEIDAAVSLVVYDVARVETRTEINGWHCTARTAGGHRG